VSSVNNPAPELRPPEKSWSQRYPRLIALALALGGWTLVTLSIHLHPDSRGYDTHTELNLPPCSFMQTTGYPCPTCGMTTAFANMAHGHVGAALGAQVFGSALFVLTAVVAVLSTAQLLTGWPRLTSVKPKMWWLWVLLAGVLIGWGTKLAMGIAAGTLPVH
jgi:hypothetical protein